MSKSNDPNATRKDGFVARVSPKREEAAKANRKQDARTSARKQSKSTGEGKLVSSDE